MTTVEPLNVESMDVDELRARKAALLVAYDDKLLEMNKLAEIFNQVCADLTAVSSELWEKEHGPRE